MRQYRVTPMTASRNELRSTVARRAATASSGRPVAAAIDRFGGELLTHLAAAIGGNIVLSPYSIAVSLAMTRAGAFTETKAQLDRVLHLEGLDTDEAFNALEQALATRTCDITGHDGEKLSVMLATANALWPQSGYPFAAPSSIRCRLTMAPACTPSTSNAIRSGRVARSTIGSPLGRWRRPPS